jgi:hypothetical protein
MATDRTNPNQERCLVTLISSTNDAKPEVEYERKQQER